jgi:hypothetical protein
MMKNNWSPITRRLDEPSMGDLQQQDRNSPSSSNPGIQGQIGSSEKLLPSSEEQLFRQPVRFLSTVSFAKLIEQPFDIAPKSTASLNVSDRVRIKLANTGAFDVTDLTKAQDGQFVLLLGDGFTTLKNNSRLVLGADQLLAANKVYPLLYLNGAWYPMGGGVSAGTGISVSGQTVSNLYVGKPLTLFAGGPITHATSGTYDWFPSNVNTYVAVLDLTGMTQFRLTFVAKSSSAGTGLTAKPAYSGDGSAWTDFSAMSTATPATAAPSFHSSAWTSLPAGARIATSWIGIKFKADSNMDIYSITAEFKP